MDELEATPAFNECTTGIGAKKSGFLRLREMADKGNTYAALRYAQVAEADTYLRDNLPDFPNDSVIFKYYKMAAEAGEYAAVSRLVDVYEKGELGQRRDNQLAKKWRNVL